MPNYSHNLSLLPCSSSCHAATDHCVFCSMHFVIVTKTIKMTIDELFKTYKRTDIKLSYNLTLENEKRSSQKTCYCQNLKSVWLCHDKTNIYWLF